MKITRTKKIMMSLLAVVILGAGAFFALRPNNTPTASVSTAPAIPTKTSNNGLPTKEELNIPSGEIVELIKAKNWTKLNEKFSERKLTDQAREKMQSQVIFSLDSGFVAPADQDRLAEALLKMTATGEKLMPRSIILLSKALGKLNLSQASKKKVTQVYLAEKWQNSPQWLDASMGWTPVPPSALKTLNALLVKNRTDLITDYFYYLRKIKDRQILKAQLRLAKNKMKSFPQGQKTYIQTQINQIEKTL